MSTVVVQSVPDDNPFSLESVRGIGNDFLSIVSRWPSFCHIPSEASRSLSWGAKLLAWAQFMLLVPCAQRALITATHACFIFAMFCAAISKLCHGRLAKRLHGEVIVNGETAKRSSGGKFQVGHRFLATVAVTVVGCLSYLGLAGLRIWEGGRSEDVLFSSIQAFSWVIFVVVVAHEKKFGAINHPASLRSWWVANFILISWQAVSAAIHLFSMEGSEGILILDDVYAFAIFPIVAFLLALAIDGRSGINLKTEIDVLTEPLLLNDGYERKDHLLVTDYAKANVVSRATWSWMSPLLKKGSQSVFELNDIPFVSPSDRAEKMFSLFESYWPKDPKLHPVRLTLLRCFWPQLLLIGLLALVRISVMYIGPLLIQSFVDYTAGDKTSSNEGIYLTLVLVAAKLVEVLTSHHYNFQSQKLGMLIRASLITTVYNKGLRLSSSARQAHGFGQIVNYMSVDVQQIADVIIQLHNMWVLPVQIAVALGILYFTIGISMFGGLITMVSLVIFTMVSSRQQKFYQSFISKMRDLRLKATSEALNNMKIIKLQAWEHHFQRRIEQFRQAEYNWLYKFWVSLSGNIFSLWISPSLVSVVTFGLCMLLKVDLTPGRVFTATATFRILMEPVRLFPQALIAISQALVSLDRLDKYMLSRELDKEIVISLPPGEETAVSVEGGNFAWDDEATAPTLKDVNISIKRGSLIAVVGTVGSGKSSLLAALLGEMPKLSGMVKVSGSTAYVAQSAWIQGATIQDNILFGQPLDQAKYKETLNVCALEEDMALMEHGDQTEIGERGINLSGGQKQRIQLARAVYQDSDIYFLDDIFSAVDAHTGSALFKGCIRGILNSKTVVLVTHQVEFLHGADQILVMRDGMIVQSGKYDEILQDGSDFEAQVLAHDNALQLVATESSSHTPAEQLAYGREDSLKLSSSNAGGSSLLIRDDLPSPTSGKILSSQKSQLQRTSEGVAERRVKVSNLVDEEQRGVGQVGWKIYWHYLTKSFGWKAPVALLVAQIIWQGSLVCSDYWLAYETSDENRAYFRRWWFFGIYAAVVSISWTMVFLRTALGTAMGLVSGQKFFGEMLQNVFRAPMSFLDTTPSGRILSRSSTDQTVLDTVLAFTVGGILGVYFATFGIVFVMIQISWPIIFVMLPLTWAFFSYQTYFISSSRELTRMDSVTKAPIIDHFSGSIAGFTTIRCFKKENQFFNLNVTRVNENLRMDFHNNGANEWLGFRLEMIGTIVLGSTAFLLVTLPTSIINPDLVGLSLSYGFALNLSLYWVVLLACTIENKMVSVERITQYTHIPSEAPLVIKDSVPSPNWPHEGKIVLQDLKLRYRANTPLVLKGLNLTIARGEKIGVVGRTGSGKSTLIQALFRLVEPAGGRILIDDVDIGTVGLRDLRSKLAIIPQEPTLFEGTVRSNIDPLGLHSDDEIWEALKKSQLADILQEKPEKLDFLVVDNGENWSVGQRQLFCLGRALLKRSRILFLDEATASVDGQTDAVIQRTVREEFATCTVISIAHRIPSVMDSDRVLVLDAGKVQEYDSPANLLSRPTSLFTALVREYAARADHNT